MIKKLINSGNNSTTADIGLLLLRAVSGLFILTHGFPKLKMLLGGNSNKFADPIGLGPELSLILVVLAEFVCGILLAIGAFTRLAAFILIINMSVITLIVHSSDPFKTKELAFLFLFNFLTILISGAGKYSIDYLVEKRIIKKS